MRSACPAAAALAAPTPATATARWDRGSDRLVALSIGAARSVTSVGGRCKPILASVASALLIPCLVGARSDEAATSYVPATWSASTHEL